MLSRIFLYLREIQAKYFNDNIMPSHKFDIEDEKQFLNSFPDPVNDFKRSYYQHRCQMRKVPWYVPFGANIMSFFAMPILIINILVKQIVQNTKSNKSYDLIYLCCLNGSRNFPKALEEEFLSSIELEKYEGQALSFKDILFLLRFLWANPCSYWLAIRILYRIGVYRYLIKKYNPKAIVMTSEVAPSSSTMTLFCKENGLEHIGMMHGERLFSIRAAFFRYDKYYVWDEYYAELLKSLRAEPTQFVVYSSRMLFIDTEKYKKSDNVVDFVYYLSNDTEEELKKIGVLVIKIENAGYSIKLRPHLRWTDIKVLKKYVKEDNIENFKDISIEESISSTNAAIAVRSTVLLQCVLSGIKVYLDDIVFKEVVEKLDARKYIVLNKEHGRLSDLKIFNNN